MESDRGSERYNSFFQNSLKFKKIHQNSRLTNKGPAIAEPVIRTVRNLLKKPIFEKGNADFSSELPSVFKSIKIPFSLVLEKHPFKIVKNQLKYQSIQITEMIQQFKHQNIN